MHYCKSLQPNVPPSSKGSVYRNYKTPNDKTESNAKETEKKLSTIITGRVGEPAKPQIAKEEELGSPKIKKRVHFAEENPTIILFKSEKTDKGLKKYLEPEEEEWGKTDLVNVPLKNQS